MMIRALSRVRIPAPGAVAVITSTGCVLSAQQQRTVILEPGQDIQAIVESSPRGTQFRFEPGVYRRQAIEPKDRQEFIGQDGMILSGAMELRGRGQNGVATDTGDARFWRETDNRFDRNTYIVADRESAYWTSDDRDAVWDDVEESGLERNGKLVVEQRAPMKLSCDR
jgi:hypothetical protein